MIKDAKQKYKMGARCLEPIIERDHHLHIPHNKIHRCLLEEGLAKEEPAKKKRRKWVRYERKHTLSAGHMDWHESKDNRQLCVIEDDATRNVLVAGEFKDATEMNSIVLFKKLVDAYWSIRPMRELIIDHGCQFGAHRIDEMGDWKSAFKQTVESNGTKIILARVKHPQTNGKIENFFDNYERHRYDFETLDEYIRWYNEIRPHESLNWKRLETPHEAFWRKMPEENILGLASNLFGWNQ